MKIKIVLLLLIVLFGCRIQSPKKRGFILTPDGFALKDTLTTKEKKMYHEWYKNEKVLLRNPIKK